MEAEDYPEHVKLMACKDRQAIGEFIEESGYVLAHWRKVDGEDVLMPVHLPVQTILARYFGIDEDKLEAEKRAMLTAIRRLGWPSA